MNQSSHDFHSSKDHVILLIKTLSLQYIAIFSCFASTVIERSSVVYLKPNFHLDLHRFLRIIG